MDALSTARSSSKDVDTSGSLDATCINALPSGTRLKNFEVVSNLGQGGFSIVYAAMDTALQRPVAVKEYMPSSFASRTGSSQVILKSQRHKSSFEAGLNSFIEEARLLAQFKHPALVEVLSFWEENGTAYMAMPLYSGKTLRQTLRDNSGRANEVWLKRLIGPVLDVLKLLHEHQIYHRDIAPDNIIIKQDGFPVLLDLGSARKVATDIEHAPTVVVKPGYAPIEQYAEDKSVPQGAWTDIYALGALLYYAVTGRPPAASVSRMMKDSLAPLSGQQLPGYSQGFLAAIDHALALQPADRPQSISEFSDLLDITNLSMPQTAAGNQGTESPDYLDEEKTVILSAADLEQLLRGDAIPQAQSNAAEHLDVFQPQQEQAPDSHSFADMEEFLNPPTAQKLGTVSVPRGRKATSADAQTPGAALTPGNGKKTTLGRSLLPWAAGIGGVVLATVVLVAAFIIGEMEQQPNTDLVATEPSAPEQPTAEGRMSADSEELLVTNPSNDTEMDFFLGPQQPLLPLASDTYSLESGSGAADLQTSALANQTEQAEVEQQVELPPAVEVVAVNTSDSIAESAPEVRQPQVTTTQSAPENTRSPARPTVSRTEQSSPQTGKTGMIELSILPWGEVWVDGKMMGVTPPIRELELPVGRRNIEIRSPGFSSLTHSIEVTADRTPSLVHEFITGGSSRTESFEDETPTQQTRPIQRNQQPAAVQPQASQQTASTSSSVPTQHGYADIRLRPWAEVWVDGEKKGIAPPLNELRLPVGEHTIEFRNPNYPSVKRTVRISSTTRATLVQNFD